MTTSELSSPDDASPFSLIEHFDPATSLADDLFVGAFILAILLLARITTRLHRQAMERRIGRHMQALCEAVVDSLATYGASEAQARWRPGGKTFHLDIIFPRGTAHLTCGLTADLSDITHAALAAYNDHLASKATEEENEEAQDSASDEIAPETDKWWHILGVPRTADRTMVRSAYRKKALENHPDHGGDPETMTRLNAARDAAETEIASHA